MTTPNPGTWRNAMTVSGDTKGLRLDTAPMNMPSMTPTNQVNTQTVMAKGVHTNKPAKRYFLNGISDTHKMRRTMQRWWLNLNLKLQRGPEMRQQHLCPHLKK
jgi:hypothetical protein